MRDYSFLGKVTIDRPVKIVWPYFFGEKRDAWSGVKFTLISGESGKVGEIYVTAGEFHGARWIMDTIRADPEKEIILKLSFQEDENAEVRLGGFDIVEFHETAGRTTVAFRQVVERSPGLSDEALRQKNESQNQWLATILQNLKQLVEGSSI